MGKSRILLQCVATKPQSDWPECRVVETLKGFRLEYRSYKLSSTAPPWRTIARYAKKSAALLAYLDQIKAMRAFADNFTEVQRRELVETTERLGRIYGD